MHVQSPGCRDVGFGGPLGYLFLPVPRYLANKETIPVVETSVSDGSTGVAQRRRLTELERFTQERIDDLRKEELVKSLQRRPGSCCG